MCGITGILQNKSASELSPDIKAINDALTRRGPDAEGFYIVDGVALGHRRLSIIDLVSGDQPMLTPDGAKVLVFNGEIYNFKELRLALSDLGIHFDTESDTEVVLLGYQAWGIDLLLSKLEGMFAFAIYDRKEGTLIVARDKFGEKPLYYIHDEERFVFASELKALTPFIDRHEIDPVGLNYFLSLTYIPAPYTIYAGVKKLSAGSYISIAKDRTIKEVVYYDLLTTIEALPEITDFAEAKDKLKSMLRQSVTHRMVSDVPIGAFLSGGIDSSIIAALMAEISEEPINTFSIGFKEKEYDESERAQLVADKIGAKHTLSMIDYDDVTGIIDGVVGYFDEPFGDSSALPSYCVARLASKDVKVVLTGDCADELFGGYEKYLANYYIERYKKLPGIVQRLLPSVINMFPHNRWTNSLLRRAKKVISGLNDSDFEIHYKLMCLGFSDSERKQLLNPDCWVEVKSNVEKIFDSMKGSSMEKGFYTDLKFVLEGDMLPKVDRVCMQNSLEARVPFLDSKLVEFAYKIPTSFKIKGKNKKYILKETFADLLPSETLGFRKQGFGVPVDYWLKNQLKAEMNALIAPTVLDQQGLFDAKYVQQLWQEHLTGKENHKGKLWNLFVFQKWYKNNFEQA